MSPDKSEIPIVAPMPIPKKAKNPPTRCLIPYPCPILATPAAKRNPPAAIIPKTVADAPKKFYRKLIYYSKVLKFFFEIVEIFLLDLYREIIYFFSMIIDLLKNMIDFRKKRN